MAFLSEAEVEQSLLEQLRGLGYASQSEEVIGPDGRHPERESHDEVVLQGRLPATLLKAYEVVRDVYHVFDYFKALTGTAQERLALLAAAMDWIMEWQQELAAEQKTGAGKKEAHRRYQDAVLALTKAFALASALDEAAAIREEVGFFQAVRAALVKPAPGLRNGRADREFAVQQIVSRAVISTEIVDILAAIGITTPDISILSEAFLLEIQKLDRKNLALEALRKLLAGNIQSRSKTNIVQAKAFTERLEETIARYHANAITTAEVLQELINLAKDVNAALRFIAQELLNSLRQNVTVDWAHRESARARLRVLVKRILRKYGNPPDLQDAAVQRVLQQAEQLSEIWSGLGT